MWRNDAFFFFFFFLQIDKSISGCPTPPVLTPTPSRKFQRNMMKFFFPDTVSPFTIHRTTPNIDINSVYFFFFHSHSFRSRAGIPTEEHHRNFPTLFNQLLISSPSSLKEFLKVRPAIIMWTGIHLFLLVSLSFRRIVWCHDSRYHRITKISGMTRINFLFLLLLLSLTNRASLARKNDLFFIFFYQKRRRKTRT